MKSHINKVSKEEFKLICKNNSTLADMIRSFGLSAEAGNYTTLKRRIEKDCVDISHVKLGISSNRNRNFERKYTKEYFLSGETPPTCIKMLKRYILEYKLKENKCEICDQPSEWNKKELVLQLDHKDGDRKNNKLDNVRLICPNCHSQTPNFSGRKTNKKFFVK